jgi:hypothetical protein
LANAEPRRLRLAADFAVRPIVDAESQEVVEEPAS